jgi:hypothetical protein
VKRSYVGRLEHLAEEPEFGDWFPLDVVNLDFTSQPFPSSQPPVNATWGSVETILANQRRHDQGLDLFLTFNAGSQGANEEAIRQLVNNTEQNFETRPWSQDLFIEASQGLTPERIALASYDLFLLLCLPKFVGKVTSDNGFAVKEMSRFSYWRHPPRRPPYRILKFLFSLEPAGGPRERLDGAPLHETLTESYDGTVRTAFQKTWIDVDKVFAETPGLSQQLQGDLRQLLEGESLRESS